MLRAVPRTVSLLAIAAVALIGAIALGGDRDDPQADFLAVDLGAPGGEHVDPLGEASIAFAGRVTGGAPRHVAAAEGLPELGAQDLAFWLPDPDDAARLYAHDADGRASDSDDEDRRRGAPAAEAAASRAQESEGPLEVGGGPLGTVEPARVSDEGYEVAPGGVSAGEGETVTYTVELEVEAGADLGQVIEVVEDALHDERGWANDVRFERVDDPDAAHIRILVATPDTVDEICGEAELDTEGIYSCWSGAVAALNADRWHNGAHEFDDLVTYRRYLVNHEVGHGLGYGHTDCPASGEPAPVMMQQTITTDACEANGWVYPDGHTDEPPAPRHEHDEADL